MTTANCPAQQQAEFDFEHRLPAGKEYFSIRYLARLWEVSVDTVLRLIQEGSIKTAADLAPGVSKHALIRIARVDLVAFLNDRANLQKMEALRAANRKKTSL